MRRPGSLRSSSTRSLCVFCASRFASGFPSAAARRPLTTSGFSRQQNVAAAASDSPGHGTSPQDGRGVDPASSLSPSERREREMLQQRRLEEQQMPQQRAGVAGAGSAKEVPARHERPQRATHHDGHGRRRAAPSARAPPGNVFRLVHSPPESRKASGQGSGFADHSAAQRPDGQRHHAGGDRPHGRHRHPASQERRDRSSSGQQRTPFTRTSSRDARPGEARRSHPWGPQTASHPPHRRAMPSFGATLAAASEATSASAGWGSGLVRRAPLKYNDASVATTAEDIGDGGMVGDLSQRQPPQQQQPDRRGSEDASVEYQDAPRSQTTLDESTWPTTDTVPPRYSRPRQPLPEHSDGLVRPMEVPSETAPGPPHAGHDFVAALQQGARRQTDETRPRGNSGTGALHDAFSGSDQGSSRRRSQGQHETPDAPYQRVDVFTNQSRPRQPRQQEQNVLYNPTQWQQDQNDMDSQQYGSPPLTLDEQSPSPERAFKGTMLDTPEYIQSSSSVDDEDQSANWRHLRRRNTEPSPSTMQPSQPLQQAALSDEEIDRRFQQHVQQRSSFSKSFQTRSQTRDQQTKRAQFLPRSNGRTVICARCKQPGHVARECTGRVVGKCNHCGQVGHFARECPQKHGKSQSTGKALSESRASGEAAGRSQRWTSDDRPGDRFDERAMGFEKPARKFRDTGADEGEASDQNPERPSRRGRFRPGEESEDALDDIRSQMLRRPQHDEVSRKDANVVSRREKARSRRREEDDDEDDEAAALREERAARKAARRAQKEEAKQTKLMERKAKQEREKNQVRLPDFINVATLAQTLGVRYETFVQRLERLGYDDVFPGKVLNAETSGMIAMEYDFEPVFESASEADERDLKARPEPEDKSLLPARPPVVTIMGHVDHGKTTILDYLRKSSVAAGEAGGITQHIGAFSVPLTSSGKSITFLDTPGHAAFLAMRQRGANVTDIVILVVAADDSVKPQTLEALRHARSANVPIIVAVNKIDKDGADLQRVKQDLARHGVEIEDFGGDTQVVPVSGKTGQGMEELEESVVTLSEILDHRAETDGMVEGWVLEATTKKAGRVATVLVRRGTLKPGAVIVAGNTWARVRSLRNEAGHIVKEIGPGLPVEVDGWRDQPMAGDEVLQAPSEQKASDVVEFRLELEERKKMGVDMEAINETRKVGMEKREKERAAERAAKFGVDYFEAAAQDGAGEDAENAGEQSGPMSVPFIVKADVSGSAEAVSAYVLSVSSPLIAPHVLRSQVGKINESDIDLASVAQGHIIAFNLPTDEGLKAQAEAKGVKVLENNIIYRVLDDVKAVLEDKLPPVVTQRVLGEAEISAAFDIGIGGRKKMRIAGCKVRNGIVGKGSRVRVTRGEEKIYDGLISSLKNVKKDVQEMRKGTECGMGFENWESFAVGDSVQTYEEISEKRRL